MTLFDGKDVQRLSITDFTPGIYGYSRGYFTTNANARLSTSQVPPLGAAAFAARCVGKPGIGLVPFYDHTNEFGARTMPSGNSPAAIPWVSFIPVGIGTLKAGFNTTDAGFVDDLSILARADYLVYVFLGQDAAHNVYTTGTRGYSSDGVTPFNQFTNLWLNVQQRGNVPRTACFTRSAQATAAGFTPPQNQLWLAHTKQINTSSQNPSVMPMMTGPTEIGSTLNMFAEQNAGLFAHTGRVNALFEQSEPTTIANLYTSVATSFSFSDPPSSSTVPTVGTFNNYFAPEDAGGIGAWGSVSTGELLIVTESRGAFQISGDVAYPSFVNRLPAVHGTGQCKQRATSTGLGMVYVTETDGVHAWNGGNMSRKISTQIPDNAALRYDLHPGPNAWGPPTAGVPEGARGIRNFHDRLNTYTFFPNNWVLDEETGSWWLCEDPATETFGVWQASACGSRFMYGQPLGPYLPNTATNVVETFDATTAAHSWTWISAPIHPSVPGMMPNLVGVEIVCSNPGLDSSATASITITPQVLSWDNPSVNSSPVTPAAALTANNPQSVTFSIPALAQGYRASQALGFTDGMFSIRIDAVGQALPGPVNYPAPVLHEVHLALSGDRPSGV